MKKIMLALLFLSANIEMMFAATGYRTGDDVVIWGPVVLIALVWAGFQVKAKLKARKEREAQAIKNVEGEQNSLASGITEN